jgi:hypothetical protein
VALWAVSLRRRSLRRHASALASGFRETPFLSASNVVLVLTVFVLLELTTAQRNLALAAPWRYWADGLEVGSSGRVPERTAQWGMEIPPTVGKVVFNAFEAGLSLLLGPAPLPAMHALVALTGAGLVAVLVGLGRELGLGAFSFLVPILTVLAPGWLPPSGELADDLGYYVAENAGRLLAFTALVVAVFSLKVGANRRLAAVSGAVFVAAALTHLIPALVAGSMCALYTLAMIFVARLGLRSSLLWGATIVTVFVVGYVGTVTLAGGDLGFEGTRESVRVSQLPPDVDPARSFRSDRLVVEKPETGGFLIPADDVLLRFERKAIGSLPHGNWPPWFAFVMFLLVAATVCVVRASRELVPVVVVAWGLAAVLLAVALGFSYRYSTQIPADFGTRRLYPYGVLSVALLLAAGLQAAFGGALGRRRLLSACVPVALVGLAVAAALMRFPAGAPAAAPRGLAAMAEVSGVVPCDARMLPNVRTGGSWEALSGRRSLLEGSAPYLRPAVMNRVLPQLLEAERFFRRPAENVRFLADHQIGYVVAFKPDVWVGSPGGRVRATAEPRLASLPGLHKILGSASVDVFRVGGSEGESAGGEPRRCPVGSD